MGRRRQRPLERHLAFQDRTGRSTSVTSVEQFDRNSVREVWRAAVQVLRPSLAVAKVDLFPDPSWGEQFEALPSAAREGWREINDQTDSRSGMGVTVDLSVDVLFAAFRDYGIESIYCVAGGDTATGGNDHVVGGRSVSVVFRKDPEFPLAYNHDQGLAVSFELTDEEHRAILDRLRSSEITEAVLQGPISQSG
jgi:hypothetical protein